MIVSALNALGSALAVAAFKLGIRKSVTLENLRHAFPQLSAKQIKQLAARSYSNLGRVFFEMLYLRAGSKELIGRSLAITNKEEVRRELSKGKGLILLSAHLANWEWMALGTGLLLDHPLHVIVKNQAGSYTERFLNRMRSRFGNRMINAGDARSAFKALQRGEIVAMLGDQSAPAGSIEVEFFGRRVPTFEGVARFALRTRSPIYLAECDRKAAGQYSMTFHHIEYDDLQGSTDVNVAELTRRHTKLLETIIRKRPELWLWQHKRWKNASAP